MLKEKLKKLKYDIKQWSTQKFGELHCKVEQTKTVVDQLDRIQEVC